MMASRIPSFLLLLLLLVCAATLQNCAQASDPELTTDFAVPTGVNASTLDGNFFTFTGFQAGVNAPSGTFKALKAFVDGFPALNGLGVSMALLEYQAGSLNPPHTHPRGTELLFVMDGTLMVGLIDTTNKMFNQTLYAGDVFVFPKGLVHFQMNPSSSNKAHALAAFSSANPGTVAMPATLFGSGISTAVLTEAFKVTPATVMQLKAPFATGN